MVKKKLKNEDSGDSTESSDEKQQNNSNCSGSSCPHISKSVDPTKLRKIIKQTGVELSKCSECAKEPARLINKDEDFDETSNFIWMCLKCGSQLCGRFKNKHALIHYEVSFSYHTFIHYNK
jgi:ubiquitin carboxyl-terminal hydrolase 16/45